MEIAFDTAKDAANRDKHGVSLAFGARIFGDPAHVMIGSAREIDGEHRYKAIGMVDDRLWTAVFVHRGTMTRFIR